MSQLFRNLEKFWIYGCDRCRNYSAKREARMFRKIISKEEKHNKKKRSVPTFCSLHQYACHTLRCPESRRRTVLNKVIMDHVSELMSTGIYCNEMYNHGIHVTQAKITSNYHLLYVFWIHTKDIVESEVDNLLKKMASYIRCELSSARVMSEIPEVRFVKDEEFLKIQYTEKILDQLQIAKDKDLTDHIVLEHENISTESESQCPPMEYNVFGLRYLNIMNNIQKSMKTYDERSSNIVRKSPGAPEFDKKELARIMFSKMYTMKKLRKADKNAVESALLEDDFADPSTDEH